MSEFFKALSEFLESDLAKTYGWVIFASFAIIVAISWSIMGFIFLKILVPSKTIEANNINIKYKALSDQAEVLRNEIDNLKEENRKLKEKLQHFQLQEALEDNGESIINRKTFSKFTE